MNFVVMKLSNRRLGYLKLTGHWTWIASVNTQTWNMHSVFVKSSVRPWYSFWLRALCIQTAQWKFDWESACICVWQNLAKFISKKKLLCINFLIWVWNSFWKTQCTVHTQRTLVWMFAKMLNANLHATDLKGCIMIPILRFQHLCWNLE